MSVAQERAAARVAPLEIRDQRPQEGRGETNREQGRAVGVGRRRRGSHERRQCTPGSAWVRVKGSPAREPYQDPGRDPRPGGRDPDTGATRRKSILQLRRKEPRRARGLETCGRRRARRRRLRRFDSEPAGTRRGRGSARRGGREHCLAAGPTVAGNGACHRGGARSGPAEASARVAAVKARGCLRALARGAKAHGGPCALTPAARAGPGAAAEPGAGGCAGPHGA